MMFIKSSLFNDIHFSSRLYYIFSHEKITAPFETMISSFPYLLSKNALYARYVS